MVFFLISSMVLGLFHQLQIFWQLYLIIVCIDVSPHTRPLNNTTFLFFAKPSLNLETAQAPPPLPFQAFSFYILVFCDAPPPEDQIFQWTPIMLKSWIGFWTWIWSMRHWSMAGSGFLILMLEKLNWFCLADLITLMLLLMWEWIGLFLRKNHLLRCQGWFFLLTWIGAVTLSLFLELPPRKL